MQEFLDFSGFLNMFKKNVDIASGSSYYLNMFKKSRSSQDNAWKMITVVYRVLEHLRKMSLHSSDLFSRWTASGSIDHPRMACFAFLARGKNARSRCDDHFVRGSYPFDLNTGKDDSP